MILCIFDAYFDYDQKALAEKAEAETYAQQINQDKGGYFLLFDRYHHRVISNNPGNTQPFPRHLRG